MKIDSHQHFWIYNPNEYGWIGDAESPLKRDFMPEEFKTILTQNDFDGSIVVQARQTIGETEWLLELAETYDFIKGVVGWVDLCSPTVEIELEKFAKNPFLKGIRHVIHDEQDDKFMLRDEFKNGLAKLQHYQLTYDLLVFPKHLPYAIQLVSEFPHQPFVLDHIAKPFIKDSHVSPWKEHIYQLAEHKNVYCKLSGMVTEADLKNWTEEDFIPYLDTVFDAFGVDRLMIGSDWPVCTLSRDYHSVINIIKNYMKNYTEEEQTLILGGNCKRFYRV